MTDFHKRVVGTLLRHKKQTDVFSTELTKLVALIPAGALETYWKANEARLLLDTREARHIKHDQVEKAEHHFSLANQHIDSLLGKDLDIGLDIKTLTKRKVKPTEQIVTVFEDGHCAKKQQPKGIHVIIAANSTLAYNPAKKILNVSPQSAEDTDDKHPNIYFFFDGVGAKHTDKGGVTYKFIYSMRLCPMLYHTLSLNS